MRKNILVVDDFINTRKVIQASLKGIDACVMMAENGEEALKYFDGRTIDLLITDLNMPKMDGIELVKNVRGKVQYMFMPIIMLSTEIRKEKKQMAMDAKVTKWMQKPFELQSFIKIVNRCLN
ncbi:MAG: response regulator [Bacteroidales bacterium]|nr:response regulator [Bacteroidales bacterium]